MYQIKILKQKNENRCYKTIPNGLGLQLPISCDSIMLVRPFLLILIFDITLIH